MFLNMAKLGCFLFCYLTAALTWSLPSDKQAVVFVRADSADLNQQKHDGTYKGHVELDQGTTHLRAHFARTKLDEQNKLIKAEAFGNEQQQAHYWTQPDTDKPMLHAFAHQIYYYPNKHLITLIGKARITQGKNVFSAPVIHFDTQKQHVITQSQKQERTTILYYSEKTS